MAPWKLPLIVAAIAVPIVAAFGLGGGGAGVAAGALAAVVVVFVAARQRPRGPISSARAEAGDARRHVLLVVDAPVDEPAAVRKIAEVSDLEDAADADVLVLSPARIGFLDRWASDVEGARRRAQQNLVAAIAALAKAGIAAEARVGDEDLVQAVEDQLQSYPASEVVLVSGAGENGSDPDAKAAEELRDRLQADFRRVVLSRGAAERRS
ncbi:MAG TPA: hypothetical protein VHQ43_03065 [Solirubrobacterales bacterium]|jgi:hypothetical protein|nr:hypothetical protein [Solirubrobacterales bacterium]